MSIFALWETRPIFGSFLALSVSLYLLLNGSVFLLPFVDCFLMEYAILDGGSVWEIFDNRYGSVRLKHYYDLNYPITWTCKLNH